MSVPKFDAFISYRRSDGAAVARWLRRELEGFRPPRSVRHAFPRKLSIYQDTAYERGTSDFYEQSIYPSLMQSKFLLVLATPDAVRRAKGEDWIQREVEDFTRGPNGRNVIAVRAAGEFNDPLPADLTQRFPNIEIVDLRGASRFWFLNPSKAARLSNEKLKLIAPLIDLPAEDMPKLRQEEEKRQQSRLGAAAGVTLAVLLAVSASSLFAMAARDRAARALESSMFTTGRMILAISGRLPKDGSTARLRGTLINEGCDLIDKLKAEADRPPRLPEIVTCHVERGLEREHHDEAALAAKEFETAVQAAQGKSATSGLAEDAQWLLRARSDRTAFLLRAKDNQGAIEENRRLITDAEALMATHKFNVEFPKALIDAQETLGSLHVASGDKAAAARAYAKAAVAASKAVEISDGEYNAALLVKSTRLYRQAGASLAETGAVAEAIGSLNNALEARDRIKPGDGNEPDLDLESAVVAAYISQLEHSRGNAAASMSFRTRSLQRLDLVLQSGSASDDARNKAAGLKVALEKEIAGATEK